MRMTIARRTKRGRGVRIASLMLIGGVVATGGLAAATTASAVATDCPVGYACIWGSPGYFTDAAVPDPGSAHAKFYQCGHDFSLVNYAGTSINANNSASSVWNRGRYEIVTFYTEPRYKGSSFTMAPGKGSSYLQGGISAPAGFDNVISSGKFSGASMSCV